MPSFASVAPKRSWMLQEAERLDVGDNVARFAVHPTQLPPSESSRFSRRSDFRSCQLGNSRDRQPLSKSVDAVASRSVNAASPHSDTAGMFSGSPNRIASALLTATLCAWPAAMAMNPEFSEGTLAWPPPSYPHPTSVASAFKPRLCQLPAAIATKPELEDGGVD